MPDLRANVGWLLRPGLLAKDEPLTWTDWEGQQYKVPKRTLSFTGCWMHARLREHVWRRDGYRCQACGALASSTGDIDGTSNVLCVDHVISRRNGGSNHPDNLQSLCRACNATKTAQLDRAQNPTNTHIEVSLSRTELAAVDTLAARWSCSRQEAIRRAITKAS